MGWTGSGGAWVELYRSIGADRDVHELSTLTGTYRSTSRGSDAEGTVGGREQKTSTPHTVSAGSRNGSVNVREGLPQGEEQRRDKEGIP